MMEEPRYYVYGLSDPRTGAMFYVGKGQRNRAWMHTAAVKSGKSSGNASKDVLISAILAAGLEPDVAIIERYYDEALAYEHEIDLIASTQGLVNIGRGGEGGNRFSPEEYARRDKIRKAKAAHAKHLRTRAWLEGWFAKVSSWPGGVTFPDMVDGDAKAADMLDCVRELISVPVPPLELALANI